LQPHNGVINAPVSCQAAPPFSFQQIPAERNFNSTPRVTKNANQLTTNMLGGYYYTNTDYDGMEQVPHEKIFTTTTKETFSYLISHTNKPRSVMLSNQEYNPLVEGKAPHLAISPEKELVKTLPTEYNYSYVQSNGQNPKKCVTYNPEIESKEMILRVRPAKEKIDGLYPKNDSRI
jgi:hypothetical protein